MKVTLNQLSNALVHYQTRNGLPAALSGQRKFVRILRKYRTQLDEILHRAPDLTPQFLSVKKVPIDVRLVEKCYQNEYRLADKLLIQLQVGEGLVLCLFFRFNVFVFQSLVELWQQFDSNQRRFDEQIGRFRPDLVQTRSQHTTISSFEHEIDRCRVDAFVSSRNFHLRFLCFGQFLRANVSSMRVLVDENGDALQKISLQVLLPQENLNLFGAAHNRT